MDFELWWLFGFALFFGLGWLAARIDIKQLLSESRQLPRSYFKGLNFLLNEQPDKAIEAFIGHPSKGAIWLKVNGAVKQKGDLSEMIWNVPEMIAYLSKLITLRAGDLIMSGTPAGVGPVRAGDRLEGHVEGVGDLTVTYAR